MSERSEKLFEAIGEVRDELLDEAARPENLKKKTPWLRYGIIAAALFLVVGIGVRIVPGMGMGGASAPNAAVGGSGSDGSSEFMSYEGPVFPLTLMEENEGITAERKLTLDFALWEPVWVSNEMQLEEARGYGATEEELAEYVEDLARWYPEGGYYDKGTDLQVRDEYVLTNSTDTEQLVEILYPYVSDLKQYREKKPALYVEETQVDCEISPGGYAGGFRGAGGEDDGRLLNLDQPTNWEDFKSLLADGSYQTAAFGPGVDLSGQKAVVYKFTDAWGPEKSDFIPNPSIRVSFDLDYSKTNVLSYGFHSGSFDPESGWMGRGYSIPEEFRWNYDHPRYLVIVGEDVENMETAFYATGGWDPELEVEGGVTIDRYETDLATALRDIAVLLFEGDLRGEYGSMVQGDFELYYELMVDWLTSYGLLSGKAVERYDYGMLGETDFSVVERVFYAKAEVVIPAQSSINVTALSTKHASFDYACTHSDNVGVSGYDAVTTLGSNLNFTAQSAVLEDRNQIEIIRQNFGFDLEQAVREVALDLETEHYYLEVRRKS